MLIWCSKRSSWDDWHAACRLLHDKYKRSRPSGVSLCMHTHSCIYILEWQRPKAEGLQQETSLLLPGNQSITPEIIWWAELKSGHGVAALARSQSKWKEKKGEDKRRLGPLRVLGKRMANISWTSLSVPSTLSSSPPWNSPSLTWQDMKSVNRQVKINWLAMRQSLSFGNTSETSVCGSFRGAHSLLDPNPNRSKKKMCN